MRHLRKCLLVCSYFLLIFSHAFSQGGLKPFAFGGGYGFRDFRGIPQGEWSQQDFTPILTFHGIRYLTPSFDLFFQTGLNLEQMPESLRREGVTDVDVWLKYKLNNGYLFKQNAFFRPFVASGFGTTILWGGPKEFNFYLPVGLGLELPVTQQISFQLQGSYKFSEFRDYVSVGAGIQLSFLQKKPRDSDGDDLPDEEDACPLQPGPIALQGCPDTDGDGIADKEDECPLVAGLMRGEGCPPPPKDSDEDGVPDFQDGCPDLKGLVAFAGCPDRDGDTVIDPDDHCPDIPGKPALQGCPDRDNDGVPDSTDDCPDLKGPFTTKGCPDTDGDGLKDAEDKCPEEAGPIRFKGCPIIEEGAQNTLDMAAQNIQFQTGSAIFTAESLLVLEEIVRILAQYGSFKLRIEGHTDDVGSEAKNLQLSEERAKACADYLIMEGIDQNRISYVGYGSSRPIADNISEWGRAQNRRVEFELYVEE